MASAVNDTKRSSDAGMSAVARIVGVLVRPGATFEDIVRRPTFLLPMVLVTLAAMAAGLTLEKKTNWPEYERQTAQANPAFSNLSQAAQSDYLAQRIAVDEKYAWLSLWIQVPVLAAAAAFFYWLVFNAITGAKLSYKTALAVDSYALMPYAIGFLIWFAAAIPKAPGSLVQPRILRTGLSAYLSASPPAWLENLAGSIELFWFWTMALTSIGFAAATAGRVSKKMAWGLVFGLWLAFVAAKVGWALIFGH